MNILLKRFSIPFICCAFFLIISCKNAELGLYIEKGSCFGQCPTFSIKIEKNGSFTYVGKRFIVPLGEKKGNLTKEEQENVKKWVKESGILNISQAKMDSLNSSFDDINYTDFPSFQLDIQSDKERKFKLKGPIPKEMTDLSKKVEALITSKLTAKQ